MNTAYGSTGGPARSLALLWTVPERASRTTRSELSLPKIVATAVELADGLEASQVGQRTGRAFEFGLRRVLDGIEVFLHDRMTQLGRKELTG